MIIFEIKITGGDYEKKGKPKATQGRNEVRQPYIPQVARLFFRGLQSMGHILIIQLIFHFELE